MMSGNVKKTKTRKQNFIIAVALLLLTNLLMGLTLITIAKKNIREQMKEHMLDISNTAAYMLDGDVLKDLTADDIDSDEYKIAFNTLKAFHENIDLDYIYAVRQEGDEFKFIIDPDAEIPAPFGYNLIVTDATKKAAKGIAGVDHESHTDYWGTFYTAYSPVFDSDHNVAAIVCVDFNAEWYENKLNLNRNVTILITLASLIIALILSFIMVSGTRKRFMQVSKEMESLDYELKKLDKSIVKSTVKKLDYLPENEVAVLKTLASGEENNVIHKDEYSEITESLRSIHKKLKKYVGYVDSMTYIDCMTGVGNILAYKEAVNKQINAISENTAAFSVGFFDINELKSVNTMFGFSLGDQFVYETANILKTIFGSKNVFRVASDEFAVVMTEKSKFDMEEYFRKFDKAVRKFNVSRNAEPELSIAKGASTFDPEKHDQYRTVFVIAEEAMEHNKAAYYDKKYNH